MKVCFAVEKDDGVKSVVYGHFGSAPAFIVVDTEATKMETVNNRDLNHVHGSCNPIQAIGGLKPDAVVVGGIGAGGGMIFTLPFVDPPAKTGVSPEPQMIRIRNRALEYLGFPDKIHDRAV